MTAEIATTAQSASAGTVLDSYATLALDAGSARLAAPMLRTRSAAARSILIYLASRGECSYRQLIEELDRSGSPPRQAMRSRRRRRWLLALASIMAAQNIQPRDRVHATAIFNAAVDRFGPRSLTAEEQVIYAQLLFLSGDFDKAQRSVDRLRRLPAAITEYLRCDLANPFVRPNLSDKEAWLARLNGPLTRRGLEPIVLWDGHSSPFDRLSANAQPMLSVGPLVTVIMTTCQPGEPLITAVRRSWVRRGRPSSSSSSMTVQATSSQRCLARALLLMIGFGSSGAPSTEARTCHGMSDWRALAAIS